MVRADDAIWMQDSTEKRAVINSMMIMRAKPDINRCSDLINDRMVVTKDPESGQRRYNKATMYSNKLLHRYVWMEEHIFDIKDHVFTHHTKAQRSHAELLRMENISTYIIYLCVDQPFPAFWNRGADNPVIRGFFFVVVTDDIYVIAYVCSVYYRLLFQNGNVPTQSLLLQCKCLIPTHRTWLPTHRTCLEYI